MNKKTSELLTVILFCGFLFGMMVLYLLLPKSDFSQREKRYLAEPPKADWTSISSGKWGADAETYMADHIPGRSFFVGLNAYTELWTGRQAAKDVWVEGTYLLEAPVSYDPAVIQKNMQKCINPFARAVNQNVDLILVPSAGWAMEKEAYQDRTIIDAIYAQADSLVTPIDITGLYEGRPELYYRTDHHWTSRGAFEAYRYYMTHLGKTFRPEEDFDVLSIDGFQGSTYSRSALWLTAPEPLELWQGSRELTVTTEASEIPHQGVFYRERLEEADKYTVFLDGNHALVRIQNPKGTGKLLLIRDSYSNCLGCFLAESYAEVVLVDLRYYRQPVSALVQQEGFDNILILYSIGNFMTDVNFSWLR